MTHGSDSIVERHFSRLRRYVFALFATFALIQVVILVLLLRIVWDQPLQDHLGKLAITVLIVSAASLSVLIVTVVLERSTREQTLLSFDRELQKLWAANNRARSLQAMASTLSATLSLERVTEVALDVCSLALDEMGIPARTLAGTVFLFDNGELVPVAARRFVSRDYDRRVRGQAGIIGEALKRAEPLITDQPGQDPELSSFVAFQHCSSAICIPLRAGFQIYGAMVLGTEQYVEFSKDHLELFTAIADQAVIALQNAQLYQKLEAEKHRLIEADAEARRELARELHDGPTQSIAAVAMRVNFVRSILSQNPRQAFEELKKIEELAKGTSSEIRGLLFALRPLVMEAGGLSAALEMAANRLRDSEGINVRVVGSEHGELLNDTAQGVVFNIVEEALGNARKYSQAKNIETRLWREEDLFVARVQDDGIGFDVRGVNASYSTRGSLGMVNMRERAERIDGSLKVESRPGRGTSVTLVVPLDRHGREGWNNSTSAKA